MSPLDPIKFAQLPGVSRSAIDRAGEVLREFWASERLRDQQVEDAMEVLIAFRSSFQLPLDKTVMGLRSMVTAAWPELQDPHVPVVQRLKRREQIMSKLERMPHTRLSNMGDIGGCRAVLDSRNRVESVFARIQSSWQIHGKARDTRDEPSPSDFGYRALHVIVIRDGRRIEIQLRDRVEHEWAVAVERTGARLSIPLKEGLGPDDLKEYFRLASEGMHLEKIGEPPGPEFDERFAAARELVRRRYFGG